ncbi:hypothetical protein BU15DRAFT_80860 [Melanogaster broomeanus]|nr:hypothetical protein BU15DRAFT_80860 [Melanogaster broomeanus]
MSTATYKQFGDDECHPPHTAIKTLINIRIACTQADPNDVLNFLKAVTGRDHRSIQRYILGVVAGAAPPPFLAAIHALLDFRYLTQMPTFDEQALAKLNAALTSFHTHKHAILDAGGRRSEHFQIPKLELLQHVMPSICASGAPMQWSVDVTEHAHVTEIKDPAHAGNNQDYYAQIACYLDRSEKCFKFDLATQIASSCEDDDGGDEPGDEEHEPNDEKLHTMSYYSPTHKIIDYFKIADALAHGSSPNTLKPFCTFASCTTASHLATKPYLRMTISEAAFDLILPVRCKIP